VGRAVGLYIDVATGGSLLPINIGVGASLQVLDVIAVSVSSGDSCRAEGRGGEHRHAACNHLVNELADI
jgi:hypothetical protein